MAKNKDKKSTKREFSEFNPCREMAKGRPAERRFWVEELIRADGRSFKSCHEAAAKAWAKAASRSGVDGTVEELADVFKSNIPGTLGNTTFMLDYTVEAIEKKFGREASYEIGEDGAISFEVSDKAAKTKKKAEKKAKVTAKASEEDDEDEDSDDDSDDEDEDDED